MWYWTSVCHVFRGTFSNQISKLCTIAYVFDIFTYSSLMSGNKPHWYHLCFAIRLLGQWWQLVFRISMFYLTCYVVSLMPQGRSGNALWEVADLARCGLMKTHVMGYLVSTGSGTGLMWFVASRHEATTSTNVDLPFLTKLSDIRVRVTFI